MSFSFLGSLASLTPGYIEGRQKAIEDNWNDLNQYNRVQQGQIQNAFDEATFADKVRMVNQGAAMGDLGYMNKLWETQLYGARMPGMMQQAGLFNQFAGMDFITEQILKQIKAMLLPELVNLGRTGGLPSGTAATPPSTITGGN